MIIIISPGNNILSKDFCFTLARNNNNLVAASSSCLDAPYHKLKNRIPIDLAKLASRQQKKPECFCLSCPGVEECLQQYA